MGMPVRWDAVCEGSCLEAELGPLHTHAITTFCIPVAATSRHMAGTGTGGLRCL